MSEKKTIFALGWVSFFMDVSSEMIYPLLPAFLLSLGAGGVAIGFVAGLSETTASFFRVISGYLSDRFKRRKSAIILGYGLSTLARPLLALSASWPHVLGFRLIDRAGKGVRTPPRDALIADSSSSARYGRAYGIQRAMDTAGAVLGPALATWILAAGMGYRSVFWISFIPAAIAVATIQLFVRERGSDAGPAADRPSAGALVAGGADGVPARGAASASTRGVKSATGPASGPLFTRELKIFLVVTAIFSLGNSSNFFLVLRAKDLGFRDHVVPILYLTMNVTYALLSYPAGRLADRFGKGRIAFLGYLLYAALYALFAFETKMNALWILFPLQGIYLAFTDGVGTAYMATLLPDARKATGFAIYYTVIGLALLPASMIGGWLWDRYSPSATFIAGSLLSLLAGTIFGIALLRGSRAPKPGGSS
ncbi:MAG: MFS transporter [Candidatus Krumholzibacteria bacterium]|nr:MFS transporter [Candidatus Krumholzibacteria bacterium]